MHNPKDFGAGLIYITAASSVLWIAHGYERGSALKMGPGYFPMLLAGVLWLIGLFSLLRAFFKPGTRIDHLAVKPLIWVLTAIVLCGILLRTAGLLIALPILVVISAAVSENFRWQPTIILAVALTVSCMLIFAKGLGLPIPLLGNLIGD